MSELNRHSLSKTDTKQLQNASGATVKNLIGLVVNYRLAVGGVAVRGVVGAAMTLVLPRYVTRFFFHDGSFHVPALSAVIGLVLIIVLVGVAGMAQTYYLRRIGENVVRDTRSRLGEKLLDLPINEYDLRETEI